MGFFLVTGGCGFIGSHLVDALSRRGHRVRVLDDLSVGKRENVPQAEIVVGDIVNADVVREAIEGVDGCFHLAAIASVERSLLDWSGTHRVNQTGTINVFDAARAAARGSPVPVVYASSAAVYGKGNGSPCSEADATRPLSAYGADKLGCGLHARIATRVHGVPTRGFRLFNVYGPRQNPSSPYAGVISSFAKRLDRGMPIDIHGDGGQVRDFIYVKDAALFLIAGMTARLTTPEIFNVCTGRPIAINQLARMLASIAGQPLVVHHGASRPGDIRMSTGDPSKALLVLQVRAETSLFVGLQRTLEWMRGTPADEAPEAGAQGSRRWQAHVPA